MDHEACRVMSNGDYEGRTFLSHPPTNYGLFYLLTIDFFFKENKLQKVTW